jgi:hypothetical protein
VRSSGNALHPRDHALDAFRQADGLLPAEALDGAAVKVIPRVLPYPVGYVGRELVERFTASLGH